MMPLDRNESYWLLDEGLGEVVHESIGIKECSRYPDYEGLIRALAAYAGVDAEHLLVTPGSDAAIEHIARMYAEEGREILLPVPTFYGYESILARVGARVTPVFYKEQEGRFVFPLEQVITALKHGPPKTLFLCEPNNPLGCALSRQELSILINAVQESGTALVSDEAYFEFSSGLSVLPFLSGMSDAMVIRTLSKAFGLSGARVGYVIAAPHVVKKLRMRLLPWPVAHPSVSLALSLLTREREVSARRATVISERDNFITSLCAVSGVTVYPSETNFVLLRVANVEHVHGGLLEYGIRVAMGESMTRFPEAKRLLKNTLRVAIPAPESRAVFVAALEEVSQ